MSDPPQSEIQDVSIPNWLGVLLCLIGGVIGCWRFSFSEFEFAPYFGFVSGVYAVYLVIYQYNWHRERLYNLHFYLTGAVLGACLTLESALLGPFTPVFGAASGFVVAIVVRYLWRISHTRAT